MAPVVEQGSTIPAGLYKFVRDGQIIAYDDPDFEHREIAVNFGLGEESIQGRRVVDDAGKFRVDYSHIVISDQSGSCDYRGKLVPARYKTAEITHNLTGQEVDVER